MIVTTASWVDLMMPPLEKIAKLRGHSIAHSPVTERLSCLRCGIVFGTRQQFDDDQIQGFIDAAKQPCRTAPPWGSWTFVADTARSA